MRHFKCNVRIHSTWIQWNLVFNCYCSCRQNFNCAAKDYMQRFRYIFSLFFIFRNAFELFYEKIVSSFTSPVTILLLSLLCMLSISFVIPLLSPNFGVVIFHFHSLLFDFILRYSKLRAFDHRKLDVRICHSCVLFLDFTEDAIGSTFV